ncbi:MAG: MjaI family restriction endonuclease [Ignavibacteriales bacterium]|nr:MjaI family restriction endonuclease [Ignavibacteriales bacterium]
MKSIKIKNKELSDILSDTKVDFPKYSTLVLNLANRTAGGTKPKVVGQLSDLIQKFEGKKLNEWENWYLEKHPKAISNATDKVVEMLENFKDVMNKIDRELIEKWIKDLVIVKTFVGLKFQEAILFKIASTAKQKHRLATPQEEAKGIDGFIGKHPVSIKPHTYKTKKDLLTEKIEVPIIYYEKLKDGINVTFPDDLLTA